MSSASVLVLNGDCTVLSPSLAECPSPPCLLVTSADASEGREGESELGVKRRSFAFSSRNTAVCRLWNFFDGECTFLWAPAEDPPAPQSPASTCWSPVWLQMREGVGSVWEGVGWSSTVRRWWLYTSEMLSAQGCVNDAKGMHRCICLRYTWSSLGLGLCSLFLSDPSKWDME